MKKILFMLLALFASVVVMAQEPQTVYDITVTAQDDKSGIWLVIGEENLSNVEELKLTGTINGYDIMIIRDKMPNLHKIDMEDVRIVANDYHYYNQYSTKDDIFGAYFFFKLTNLTEVKLPSSIIEIEESAIGAEFGKQMKIPSITIPEGVQIIKRDAFSYGILENIVFPTTLRTIGGSAFYNNHIVALDLSNCRSLLTIESRAFQFNRLQTIRIPESVQSIQEFAFANGSGQFTDLYVQAILPRTIPSNLFPDVSNTTLHVPPMTYYDYYWKAGWSAFGTIVEDVNPNYFYVDADLTIAEDKADNKTVDADVEANGGIINEDSHTQAFDDLNVANDGTNSGSLIGNDNLTANNLCFNINVTGNHWHFFSFPFRINLNNVVAPGAYVFRRYNGSNRALGNSGWEDLPAATEYLEPGVGYIFQCNKGGTLKISVASPNFNWASMTTTNSLTAYAAANDQDASWNFVGNPLTSYYDIDDMHFDAPLTVWNGSNYVAYRPGDDNYQLHPFEAFFIQKPDGNMVPTYSQGGCMTYNQATNHHNHKAPRKPRMGESERYLLNLVLSNGEQEDRTRVVFNEKHTAAYERACDAAKFMSMEQVPQLYTLDQQTTFAINERQKGSVQVGFIAPTAGSYTLRADRMDMQMVLKDAVTGITFNLGEGEYTFQSEAGTFNSRFMLMPATETTGIKNVTTTESNGPTYTLDGRMLPEGETVKGIVIENGKKIIK